MNFRKAILNFFTLLNTVYLGLVIYIEFFMENLTKDPYEIYYDLWMYVFVMLLRIIIIFIHKNNMTYFFDLKFHKVTLPNIAKLKIKIAQ